MIRFTISACLIAAISLASSGCERAPVSYGTDVKPILNQHCASCHLPGTQGYEKSTFGIFDHAALMKGTQFGPVVLPGDSFNSNLIVLVEGRADPAIAMPHEGSKLSDEEIETLKDWIDQGALDN